MAPTVLPANLIPQGFYLGGQRITDFRSDPPCSAYQPEDWIASTTCCSGSSSIGLSRLPDGRLLVDAIQEDPKKWLGEEHLAKWGADTKLLLKLLDAGQRLPVHAHPHVDWAKKHVGSKHGKAETWYILRAGSVWLGLKESISQEELLELVEAERGTELLEKMHKLDVTPHQTVYVPPGTLHAIGEGILVVEVQEPTDLSILCEWNGFKIDGKKGGHLGVGFEKALTAVDIKPRTTEEIMKLVSDPKDYGTVGAKDSQEYYRLERLDIKDREECPRGFAILVVLDGKVELKTKDSESLSLAKGSTVVAAYGDGDFVLEGQGEVVIARPPL